MPRTKGRGPGSSWGDLAKSLASIAFASGLLVALLRYRLYDAERTIGRSAAYGVLTVGFVGLFAGSEKLAEIVGERYFEHSIGIAAGAVGAAVAATCIVPLHNRVHRWADALSEAAHPSFEKDCPNVSPTSATRPRSSNSPRRR